MTGSLNICISESLAVYFSMIIGCYQQKITFMKFNDFKTIGIKVGRMLSNEFLRVCDSMSIIKMHFVNCHLEVKCSPVRTFKV